MVVSGRRHALAALPPGKTPRTYYTGCRVGSRSCLVGRTGFRSLARQAHRGSLYRLSYRKIGTLLLNQTTQSNATLDISSVLYECAYCLETYLFSFALRESLFPCDIKRRQSLIGYSSSDSSFRAALQPPNFHGPQVAYDNCDRLKTSLTCLVPLPFLYVTHETW